MWGTKKVFPAFCAVLALGMLWSLAVEGTSIMLLGLVALAVLIGAIAMYRHLVVFADEVLDYGDHLVIRKGSITEKVVDIIAVKEAISDKQPKSIELYLERPGRLGKMITFAGNTLPGEQYTTSALAKELIERVERAHRGTVGTNPLAP